MIRVLQLSLLAAAIVVARHFLFRWLNLKDSLPQLVREAFESMFGYFVYMTAGLFVFSLIAGKGFGAGSTLAALVIMLAASVYVGAGVLGLWLYLRRTER